MDTTNKKALEKIDGIANIIIHYMSETELEDILPKLYSEAFETSTTACENPTYEEVRDEVKKIISKSKETSETFNSHLEIHLPNGDIIEPGVGIKYNLYEIEKDLFGRDYSHNNDYSFS